MRPTLTGRCPLLRPKTGQRGEQIGRVNGVHPRDTTQRRDQRTQRVGRQPSGHARADAPEVGGWVL